MKSINSVFKKLISNLRKNDFINFLELNILSYLAWLIIQLVSATLKIYKVDIGNIKNLKTNKIFAFFHGEQFVLIPTHKHRKYVIMTSYSLDGELQTRILKKFGYDIVRGSASKKGATSGTLSMIEKVLNGQNCAVAVDGPHGPGFKVKPGVIFLAQKTSKPIVPVRVFINKKITLNNWDKYMFPLPFSNVFIVYASPMVVHTSDSIKEKTLELESILKNIDFTMVKNNSFF